MTSDDAPAAAIAILASGDGRIVAVSPALPRWLARSAPLLVGQPLHEILAVAGAGGEDLEALGRALTACRDRMVGDVVPGRIEAGAVAHRFTPLRDAHGDVVVVYELTAAIDREPSATTDVAAEALATTGAASPSADHDAARGDRPDGRPTVLVVEDHDDLRYVVVQTLAAELRCLEAADGVEGLEQALRHRPDVIVTDVVMPTMGGDNLALTLRDLPALADTPLLVLSARTDRELRVRLLEAGVDDYVTKPFDPDELRARVLNLVRRAAARP